MTISIKTKFLLMSTVLVALTIASLSGTYYFMIWQMIQRKSQQRIRIAFDILLTDFADHLKTITQRLEEFLVEDTILRTTTATVKTDPTRLTSRIFLANYVKNALLNIAGVGHNLNLDRLALYGADGRLLAIYQKQADVVLTGVYMLSETDQGTFLTQDDIQEFSSLFMTEKPLPDRPLPQGISAAYAGAFPTVMTISMFREGSRLGFRMIAPILDADQQSGILVGDIFYSQAVVEHYASLSKSEINLFVPGQFSVGTLPAQPPLSEATLKQLRPCQTILEPTEKLDVLTIPLNGRKYYQGSCAYTNGEEIIGAISVNLLADMEQQDLRRIWLVVLIVSGLAFGGAVGATVLFSRKPLRSMQSVMQAIGAVANGHLGQTATVLTQDEFGGLAAQVNQMITQLYATVMQVQQAGVQVSASATQLAATAKEQEVTMSHQLESANQVVKAAQEISDVTTELLATMQRVATMAEEASGFASHGQTDLFRMEEAMRHMEDASSGISEKLSAINAKAENITVMVTTINKVSEQTNLLSLNASIEAEKAGEYGRGFAVVAREIRRLADQTAVATLDIERMVREMQSAVSSGITEMDKFITEVQQSAENVAKISMQISLIIDQVQALSPNFVEVSQAMGQQSDNALQIHRAILNLSEEMQQMKAALHETYTSVAHLNDAAESLQEGVSRFQMGT